MSKQAKTAYPIHSLLNERWSPRAFDSKPIEKEKVISMLEAARWSPSASNDQPWNYIVGFKGDETYAKIFETLVEFNQMWCEPVPMLMLGMYDTKNAKGLPNAYAEYDLGQSLALLSVQAMEHDIYIHQMGGFEPAKAKELFNIPEGFEVKVAVALGYKGEPEILHPRMQKSETAERERKELKEFVFSGSFGQTAEFL